MTPHTDHQRRVEEILGEMRNAALNLRPFAERLARAEAENMAMNKIINQRQEELLRYPAEIIAERDQLRAKLSRLRAMPLDEGLRERALEAIEMLLGHSYDLGDDRRNNIRALLRDLRTPPTVSDPIASTAKPKRQDYVDPDNPNDIYWVPREGSLAKWRSTPTPTLTDRERIERLEQAFYSIDQLRVSLRGPCPCCYYHGPCHSADCPVGAIARELASRKDI